MLPYLLRDRSRPEYIKRLGLCLFYSGSNALFSVSVTGTIAWEHESFGEDVSFHDGHFHAFKKKSVFTWLFMMKIRNNKMQKSIIIKRSNLITGHFCLPSTKLQQALGEPFLIWLCMWMITKPSNCAHSAVARVFTVIWDSIKKTRRDH